MSNNELPIIITNRPSDDVIVTGNTGAIPTPVYRSEPRITALNNINLTNGLNSNGLPASITVTVETTKSSNLGKVIVKSALAVGGFAIGAGAIAINEIRGGNDEVAQVVCKEMLGSTRVPDALSDTTSRLSTVIGCYEVSSGKVAGGINTVPSQVVMASPLGRPMEVHDAHNMYRGPGYGGVINNAYYQQGWDVAAEEGEPVEAPGPGILHIFPESAGNTAGMGNVAMIEFGPLPGRTAPTVVQLGHLQGFPENVHDGDVVGTDDIIGYVGSTGVASGAHLDIKVYEMTDIRPSSSVEGSIDPALIFSPSTYSCLYETDEGHGKCGISPGEDVQNVPVLPAVIDKLTQQATPVDGYDGIYIKSEAVREILEAVPTRGEVTLPALDVLPLPDPIPKDERNEIFTDEYYTDLDASKYLDVPITIEGFLDFLENRVDISLRTGFAPQAGDRLEEDMEMDGVVIHWTAGLCSVLDCVTGMMSRAQKDDACPCDTHSFIGKFGDEKGKWFLTSPHLDSFMYGTAGQNARKVNIENVANPDGWPYVDNDIDEEQFSANVYATLVYAAVGGFPIDRSHVVGHSDIDPGREATEEPGPGFVDIVVRRANELIDEINENQPARSYNQGEVASYTLLKANWEEIWASIVEENQIPPEQAAYLHDELIPAVGQLLDKGSRVNGATLLAIAKVETGWSKSSNAAAQNNNMLNMKAGDKYKGPVVEIVDDDVDENNQPIPSRFFTFDTQYDAVQYFSDMLERLAWYKDALACGYDPNLMLLGMTRQQLGSDCAPNGNEEPAFAGDTEKWFDIANEVLEKYRLEDLFITPGE